MCGICGFTGRAEDAPLEQMRDALVHRGPDDSGRFSDEFVQLAHRRLAIVDIEHGTQPFLSADGAIVLVFNGEIYNYASLRGTLERLGHDFRTRSDTESIIHAYIEYGDRCAEHLDGMFAFVLYDKRARKLYGARDRFGKKPLFYSTPLSDGTRSFVFASEIRSLMLHPAIKRSMKLSQEGVISYLLHDYTPGNGTALTNVFRIPAGHAFRISLDDSIPERLQTWSFWRNPILDTRPSTIDEASAIVELDRLLDAAVQRRLMSDVPLGVFLSGGIDSSAIVSYMARHVDPAKIRTFAIGFDDPSFDESTHAALAAEHFGTQHEMRRFNARDCLQELSLCLEHMDEPLADPSILPTSMLSRFAREFITVALGGDGGDELFAGYDPFRALAASRIYDRFVPLWVHQRVAAWSQRLLRDRGENMSLAFRVNRFLRGAKIPEADRMTTWLGAFDAESLTALAGPRSEAEFRDQFLQSEREIFGLAGMQARDSTHRALAYFQSLYLVDDILVKADRASMMHSLELRSPFLDTELASFVNRLPARLKYRRGKTKYLLKKMLADGPHGRPLIPLTLLHRPKKGFGIPVSRWIRSDLRETFEATLVSEWPQSLSFLNANRVRAMLNLHNSGARDFGKELWSLFILCGWLRRWAV